MSRFYGIVDAREHSTEATRGSGSYISSRLKTWQTSVKVVLSRCYGEPKLGKRGKPIKRYGEIQHEEYNVYEIYLEDLNGRQTQPIMLSERDILTLIDNDYSNRFKVSEPQLVMNRYLDDVGLIQLRTNVEWQKQSQFYKNGRLIV